MLTIRRPLITALVALVALTGAAFAQDFAIEPIDRISKGNVHDLLRGQLENAADDAGVRIQSREMTSFVREEMTLIAASTEGFEFVPATALEGGVDVGFAFFDAPRTTLPTGYYTIRASAENVAVGQIEGQVELVGTDGEVVATFPATMGVRTLDVPAEPQYNRTVVGGAVDLDHETGFRKISVWIVCPNGMAVCFEMDLFDYWMYF
ncbi:MAG: hypothetical protein AAGN66_09710 [Acidobacteriota bacterium]